EVFADRGDGDVVGPVCAAVGGAVDPDALVHEGADGGLEGLIDVALARAGEVIDDDPVLSHLLVGKRRGAVDRRHPAGAVVGGAIHAQVRDTAVVSSLFLQDHRGAQAVVLQHRAAVVPQDRAGGWGSPIGKRVAAVVRRRPAGKQRGATRSSVGGIVV